MKAGIHPKSLIQRAADQLLRYPLPGNVREVQNSVDHAVALSTGSRIEVEDLPEELRAALPRPRPAGAARPLADVEKEYILAAVEADAGNRTRAATLKRKLKAYGAAAPPAGGAAPTPAARPRR